MPSQAMIPPTACRHESGRLWAEESLKKETETKEPCDFVTYDRGDVSPESERTCRDPQSFDTSPPVQTSSQP